MFKFSRTTSIQYNDKDTKQQFVEMVIQLSARFKLEYIGIEETEQPGISKENLNNLANDFFSPDDLNKLRESGYHMTDEVILKMSQPYKLERVKYRSSTMQIVLELSNYNHIPIFGFWNWLGIEPNFTSGFLYAKSNDKESLNQFIKNVNNINVLNNQEQVNKISELTNTTWLKVQKELGVSIV